jgi:hypothetical protein
MSRRCGLSCKAGMTAAAHAAGAAAYSAAHPDTATPLTRRRPADNTSPETEP